MDRGASVAFSDLHYVYADKQGRILPTRRRLSFGSRLKVQGQNHDRADALPELRQN
jgi:hypothetical protein